MNEINTRCNTLWTSIAKLWNTKSDENSFKSRLRWTIIAPLDGKCQYSKEFVDQFKVLLDGKNLRTNPELFVTLRPFLDTALLEITHGNRFRRAKREWNAHAIVEGLPNTYPIERTLNARERRYEQGIDQIITSMIRALSTALATIKDDAEAYADAQELIGHLDNYSGNNDGAEDPNAPAGPTAGGGAATVHTAGGGAAAVQSPGLQVPNKKQKISNLKN